MVVVAKYVLPVCYGLQVESNLLVVEQGEIAHLDQGCQFQAYEFSVHHCYEHHSQEKSINQVGYSLDLPTPLILILGVHHCLELIGGVHRPG